LEFGRIPMKLSSSQNGMRRKLQAYQTFKQFKMTTAHNTGSVEAETMGQPPAWTPHSKQHMLESFK
jgi:hypothetical protein